MPGLPSGTVTFLFTDIEGSTSLLHDVGPDAFFAAFPTAPGALSAAAEAQQALEEGPRRVRMGIHTGTMVRASLDEAALTEAWEQGRTLTVDEAVAPALEEPS